MSVLPLWARALRRIDRAAWYAYQVHQTARDELLFAWLKPELRAKLTVLAYSDMRAYLPGGTTFEAGLFGWERALFAEPCIPRTGRVLLAAAGGGRELKALLEAGYAVTAFEPNPLLFEAATEVASAFPLAEIFRAEYADLSAPEGEGPLASLRGRHFDWVLFGWGSFTHLTEPGAQLAALESVRALAPEAPVVLSFYLRKPHAAGGRAQKLRDFMRNTFRRLGAEQPIDPGLGYSYIGGFVYSFTPEQIRDLASVTGYRVVLEDSSVFPYAILAPI